MFEKYQEVARSTAMLLAPTAVLLHISACAAIVTYVGLQIVGLVARLIFPFLAP